MHPFGSRTALIGHTGFVGSNLASQHGYTAHYNSRNIDTIAGQEFDTIVCAGVSAVKYLANQQPEADWRGIRRLLDPLSSVTVGRFILISTIDVYSHPANVTEADPASVENHAYGRHRLAVEEFVEEHFPCANIIRLPALFGAGLKKNILFDLLHRNGLESIQPAGSYQYYAVNHLTRDLLKVLENDIPLLNLATGPLSTRSILDRFAPHEEVGSKSGAVGHYDFRSLHAGLWGGSNGYLYDAEQVMADLVDFFAAGRASLT